MSTEMWPWSGPCHLEPKHHHPKLSSPAPAPVVKETDDVEGNVTPPAAVATPKGKPAVGALKPKPVRLERKKSKKVLEAEKKVLDLR